MRTIVLILAILPFIIIPLEGQYKVVNYTDANKVSHLLEDGEFIWTCTAGGIFKRRKSNGTVVSHFNMLNSGLKYDGVGVIYKDSKGNYWISYSNGNGFTIFDGSKWEHIPFIEVSGVIIYNFWSVVEDLQGNLLFVTSKGLLKYDREKWEFVPPSANLMTHAAVVDDYGNIWFSLSYPLYKMDIYGNIHTYTPPESFNLNVKHITKMAKDGYGKLWLSFNAEGILSYDPATDEWEDHRGDINYQYISGITTDNSGNIWFTAQVQGAYRYNLNSGITTFFPPPVSTRLNCILCDVNGNVWLGTEKGLSRIDFSTGQWTNPYRVQCIPTQYIGSTHSDSKGNTFMAGSGSIQALIELTVDNIWKTYPTPGYPRNMVIDDDDNKWTAYRYLDKVYLVKYDADNEYTLYTISDALPGYPDTYQITKDNYSGYIWVSSEAGLIWFNPVNQTYGRFTTSNSNILSDKVVELKVINNILYYSTYLTDPFVDNRWGTYNLETGQFSELTFEEDILTQNVVLDFLIDQNNIFWITTPYLLVRKNNEEISTWNLPYTISYPNIIKDNFDNLWIYRFPGALKFDGTNFELFNTEKGLLGQSVWHINIDRNNNVWLSDGYNGVTRLIPVAPKADFIFSTECLPEATVFTNTSAEMDNLTKFSWDIGNNGTVDFTTKDFSHVFADEGVYEVKLTACNDDLCSEMLKEVRVHKAPEVKLNYSGDMSLCDNTVIPLEAQIVYSSSEHHSYFWNTGSTSGVINISEAGMYYAEVSDAYCSGYTDTLNLSIVKPYTGASICMVTVDVEDKKNMIVWDNIPDQGIASYNVYKLYGNNYVPVGNVAYGDRPLWVDYTSTPQAVAARYAISVIDTCGNESAKSQYHQTMFLGASQGVQPNTVVLNWTRYVDESGGWNYEYFYIFRGSSPDSMMLHDSVSSAFTEWNDLDAQGNIFYMVGIKKDVPCYAAEPSKKAGAGPFVHSFSNLEDNQRAIGIEKYGTDAVRIYPNPAGSYVRIKWENPDREEFALTIYDISGNTIRIIPGITEDQYEMELENIQAGYYIVELRGKSVMRTRLVVQ